MRTMKARLELLYALSQRIYGPFDRRRLCTRFIVVLVSAVVSYPLATQGSGMLVDVAALLLLVALVVGMVAYPLAAQGPGVLAVIDALLLAVLVARDVAYPLATQGADMLVEVAAIVPLVLLAGLPPRHARVR